MKKVNEKAENEQRIVVILCSEDAIPKEKMAPLLPICVQKFSEKTQVSDSVFFSFIEEIGVNICIWHSQMAEWSKNNI